MSLTICPIQEVCSKYHNGIKNKDNHTRLTHPCNDFLASTCDMAVQLEWFLSDKPIACSIDKHKAKKE